MAKARPGSSPIAVEGGRDLDECRKVGYAIGHSPLVKTAFFASDPNLGRILAAIGYAGIGDLDVDGIKVWLDDVLVAEQGGRAAAYREEDGARVMKQSEITIRVGQPRSRYGDGQGLHLRFLLRLRPRSTPTTVAGHLRSTRKTVKNRDRVGAPPSRARHLATSLNGVGDDRHPP